jgi:muramoyltetrapeptide carboxypeptidase
MSRVPCGEHDVAMGAEFGLVRGRRLVVGDRVRIVSPSSAPVREEVERGAGVLERWGLRVELGRHVFDRWGPMAGRDEDRLRDLDEAFADPGVRAVLASRGGAGAYRIADRLDMAAVRRDPKPFVGFSDATHLHLALWSRCRLATVHAPFMTFGDDVLDAGTTEAVRRALMTADPVTVHRDPDEPTAALTVPGTAVGTLVGGNLTALRTEAGCGLPRLEGAILLLEHVGDGLRHLDRALTQLRRSGALTGLRGVVLGQFLGFEDAAGRFDDGGWGAADVLADHLDSLGVPVLGGVPVGHRDFPLTLPLGTEAAIDAAAGTLTVQPAVS